MPFARVHLCCAESRTCVSRSDADRTKKLGFDEFIQSDPCKFDHHDLFKTIQTATLDFRLNDPYCSLVSATHPKCSRQLDLYIRAG